MDYPSIYSIMIMIAYALGMVATTYPCIINLLSLFALASRKLKTKYKAYML